MKEVKNMKKVLGLLSSIAIVSGGSVSIFQSGNSSNEINAVSSYNLGDTVNLQDIVLSELTINLNSHSETPFSLKVALMNILMVEATDPLNKEYADQMTAVSRSVATSENVEDNWYVDGMIDAWPKRGEVVERNIMMMYTNSDLKFDGILSFNVKLVNEAESNDLTDLISVKDLGILDNPSEDDILKEVSIKNNINFEKLRKGVTCKFLDYQNMQIDSIPDGDFSGNVVISYSATFSELYNTKIMADDIYAEAYDSNQSDSSISTVASVAPKLGEALFLKTFKFISYNFYGQNWDNKHGTNMLGDEISTEHTVGETKIFAKKLKLDSESYGYTMFKRDYSGPENGMHSSGKLITEWSGNDDQATLSVKFEIEVHVYATAWNALWAEASVSNAKVSEILVSTN
jgi:hypothetical protein